MESVNTYETEYSVVRDETIGSIVQDFKERFYSDIQMSRESTKYIADLCKSGQEECVDAFLQFLGDDLRKNLLKALGEVQEYAKKRI